MVGSSGTHSVCVCTTHENMKLMFLGSKMDKLKWSEDSEFKDHGFSTLDSLTKFIICNEPTQECHMGRCFHNNSMVTLHPFVGYYKDEDILKHVNFVSISECNIHDSVSVHLFITQLLSHIKEKLPIINKIIY